MRIRSVLKKISSIKKSKKEHTFAVKTDTACISAFESWTMIFVFILMGFYGVLLIAKLVGKQEMQINQNIIRTNPKTSTKATNITREDGIELQITLTAHGYSSDEFTFEEQMEIFSFEIYSGKWGTNQDGQVYSIGELLQTSTGSEDLQQTNWENKKKSWGIDLTDSQLEGSIGVETNTSAIYGDILVCEDEESRVGK